MLILSTITTPEEGKILCECFEHYYKRLYSRAYRRLRSHADTEDMIQATFERIAQYPDKFMSIARANRNSCLGYLFTTLDTRCQDLFDDRKKRPAVVADLDEPWLRSAVQTPDFQEPLHSMDLVVRIMKNLSPQGREIIMLYFVGGYTAKEIAQMFHVTESSVNALIHRVRVRLSKEAHIIATIF